MKNESGAVSYLPYIFKCLEADVLGGEAFSQEIRMNSL